MFLIERLVLLSRNIQNPWLLYNDHFNNILSSKNKIGSIVTMTETQEFQKCVDNLQVTPIKAKE